MTTNQDQEMGIEGLSEQLKAHISMEIASQNEVIASKDKAIIDLMETIKKHEIRFSLLDDEIGDLLEFVEEEELKHMAEIRKLEKKLASKDTKVTEALRKLAQMQKLYEEIYASPLVVESTTKSIVPKKRSNQEETSINLTAMSKYLEAQGVGECDIMDWRNTYEAAELLEGCTREMDIQSRQSLQEEAGSKLQVMKNRIAIKARRAQELEDMQTFS